MDLNAGVEVVSHDHAHYRRYYLTERDPRWMSQIDSAKHVGERIEGRRIPVGGGTAEAVGCFLVFATLAPRRGRIPRQCVVPVLILVFHPLLPRARAGGRTGSVVIALVLTPSLRYHTLQSQRSCRNLAQPGKNT